MEIGEFFSISIVGIVASGIIELVTQKLGTASLGSKLVTIAIALIIGTGYFLIRNTPWFASVITVLTTSSAVYALLIKKS